ncbi:MAG: zinc-ribbon domain-containing protein [Butyrivibrio sp.]|nr:zinc-ribbon domain-containing protein [Butyrivibrio sp.]
MKFCPNCGAQIPEGTLFCSNCGTDVKNLADNSNVNNGAFSGNQNAENNQVQGFYYDPGKQYDNQAQNQYYNGNGAPAATNNSGLKTAIKVFLVLSCVSSIWFVFIPLCWMLPMTIVAFKKMNNNQPLGLGFKICTLIFVNMIAGILMLCMNDENQMY